MGAGGENAPLDESAGVTPRTPHSESKILTEQDLAPLADDDFSPTFARNATAYGLSPRRRRDLVVNDLAHAQLAGDVRLLSDDSGRRPLVHTEDIAAAFLAMREVPRERVHGRAFNVSQTEENYFIRDVAVPVHELVGGTVTYAAGSRPDARYRRVSCDFIAAEVSEFRPQWTVSKGIEQLVEKHQPSGLTLAALTGERHQWLRRINAMREAGRLDDKLRWTSPGVL
jgi:nucleoside-diphosphate-sugar epimerase